MDVEGIDLADVEYRMGRSYAGKWLRRGLHPDGVRFRLHSTAEIAGRPWGPHFWRGVEDALAGRPCEP